MLEELKYEQNGKSEEFKQGRNDIRVYGNNEMVSPALENKK
jgi:hypothetical protein